MGFAWRVVAKFVRGLKSSYTDIHCQEQVLLDFTDSGNNKEDAVLIMHLCHQDGSTLPREFTLESGMLLTKWGFSGKAETASSIAKQIEWTPKKKAGKACSHSFVPSITEVDRMFLSSSEFKTVFFTKFCRPVEGVFQDHMTQFS